MGTFERLSVVVIGVILVMILVVAVATWQEDPAEPGAGDPQARLDRLDPPAPEPQPEPPLPTPDPFPLPDPDPDPLPPLPQPDPAPAPEPEPTPGPAVARLHVVKAGESLGVIAAKYYPSSKYWKQLQRWNKLESERIAVGQELEIPSLEELGIGNLQKQGTVVLGSDDRPAPGGTWLVRKGQDLPTIAKLAYDDPARWPDIWIANRDKVKTPDELEEGVVLNLPR